jgi:tetratricopeptide (TPR) repeat protein
VIEREPANARARIPINLHRPAEALEQLPAIEKLEPGNAMNSLRGGQATFLAGDLVNAERRLRIAIELDRTITEAWIVPGQALSAAGRLSEAIELLGTAPEEAGRARILTGLGDLQAEAGDLSAAVADYESALKLDATIPRLSSASQVSCSPKAESATPPKTLRAPSKHSPAAKIITLVADYRRILYKLL